MLAPDDIPLTRAQTAAAYAALKRRAYRLPRWLGSASVTLECDDFALFFPLIAFARVMAS
jgi:hypothetical protein